MTPPSKWRHSSKITGTNWRGTVRLVYYFTDGEVVDVA
jgi:hypothetical protein